MAKDLLTATDVSMVFGGLKAIVDFNVHIKNGELLGLIGPNGAGKTTAFNLFTGVYQPTTGEILFKARASSGSPRTRSRSAALRARSRTSASSASSPCSTT